MLVKASFLFLLCPIILSTSCATSNWALRNASGHSYSPYSYPTQINKAVVIEQALYVDLKIGGEPEQFADRYSQSSTICFDRKKDFTIEPNTRIDGGQLKRHQCLSQVESLAGTGLTEVRQLQGLMIIPEFNVALEFFPFAAGSKSTCLTCANFAEESIEIIAGYRFSNRLFYLKSIDNKWYKFNLGKQRKKYDFSVQIASEKSFKNETGKPKKFLIKKISNDYFLRFRLPQRQEIIFSSPQPIILANSSRVNNIIFTQTAEEKIVIAGQPLYYFLLPFTIAADIITFPYQIYLLSQANRSS
jgi:hypothetical protein